MEREKISAVFKALKYEDFDRLKELIEGEPDLVNCRSSAQRTPLHTAARRGFVDAVRYLLQRGADTEAKDYRDWTPLEWAVDHQQDEVIKILQGNQP